MSASIPEQLLEQVAERFRLLGDATRLAILRTLLNDGELNVGELVERLQMSQANVSKHLRMLYDAGVVARRPHGTAAYYQVSDPTVVQLCDVVCDRLRHQFAETAEVFARS